MQKPRKMAKHILKVNDSLPIKDLAEFIYNNQIKQDDEIIVEKNTFTNLDFITRHVLFLLMRECISNNRKYASLRPLAECKLDTFKFYDNISFADAFFQETGVKITFDKGAAKIASA